MPLVALGLRRRTGRLAGPQADTRQPTVALALKVFTSALALAVRAITAASCAVRVFRCVSEPRRVFRRLLFVRRTHDERYKEQVFA